MGASNDGEADRLVLRGGQERLTQQTAGNVIREAQNLSKYSPNIHTSLAEVKRRKLIDSGAIHLIGNFPLEARRLILQSEFSLLSTEESNSYS